ncbi:DsbA family protein [Kroppenstedtia pulmonis]|uniref:DsbA family protein n=1 Tax=Kroppenstedtia pulmonis TaxID=1380685 RepID=A0A7D3Y0J7_9BACL|nr:DsbA family protein [Kroppenstedtia pulmonis]QKG83683.1 DsbA family protein [Kroppenstedtia pulmonis]
MSKKKKSNKNSKERVQKKQAEARARRMKSLTIGTLITLALIAGIYFLVSSGSSEPAVDRVKESVFAYGEQPVTGNPDAKVKIVEFGDYKCPACGHFATQIFPQLKKDFLDTEKAGFYFINNPLLGPDSVTAAIAGEAVYQQDPDSFWDFFRQVYENQGSEQEKWATPDFLTGIAKKVNPDLDDKKLKKDIEDSVYVNKVNKDRQIAEKANVTSVPRIFINGREIPSDKTFDYPYIKKIIEEEYKQGK